MKVENPGGRCTSQDGIKHFVLRGPSYEGKNSQVRHQQGKRIGARVGRGQHNISLNTKENAGDKRDLSAEKLPRGPKKPVSSREHGQHRGNSERNLLAAEHRLYKPEDVKISE